MEQENHLGTPENVSIAKSILYGVICYIRLFDQNDGQDPDDGSNFDNLYEAEEVLNSPTASEAYFQGRQQIV